VPDLSEAERPPPPGFGPSTVRGAFSRHNGPIFERVGEGRIERGFYVLDRHCNGFGVLHGGMVTTFLDALLAAQGRVTTGRVGMTIQLSTDFLHMARQGDWVAGDAVVTRQTSDLLFIEGRACVGGRDIARAHAIFKLMKPRRAE
jgi:uncharacterized protein (TIGR00369 family)